MTTFVRKRWVDTVRGICMLAIVLFHTDVYLVGKPVLGFDLYVSNALMAFFVVSGYLFFRGEQFSLRQRLYGEVRHLLIPYFIFTLLIAFVKVLVRGEEFTLGESLINILLGRASWFVAARFVAGVIFAVIISLSMRSKSLILPIACGVLAAVPFIFDCSFLHVWNIDIALMSLVYFYLGYIYHAYEGNIERHVSLWLCLPALLLVVALKWFEQSFGIAVPVSPSRMSSFLIFLVDTCLSAFVVITLCKRFNGSRFINYVGRTSLVYYFLCGGVPFLVGMAFKRFGLVYTGNYLLVLAAFVLVVLIISALTFVIVRYLPFMLGRTRSDVGKAFYKDEK